MRRVRTTSENPDFKYLTRLFDAYLVDIDGDEKDFFAQYNQIELQNVIVCYKDAVPVGCGAFKEYSSRTAEIKRMFVLPEYRGHGIASSVLGELEAWAKEEDYQVCILETSEKLQNAITLYKKSGYTVSENYGQYIGVESSVCMVKIL